MKKVLRYSLILCLLLGAKAYAQDRVVSGKVTAADDKLPIPGVTVKAVGASAATQTNADGLFTLSIPEGVTQLQFSFLGYATRTLPIAAGSMNVVLKQDSEQLQEVIIVGALGTKRSARSTSSNTQSVDAKQLNTVQQTNLNNALAGKVSGIQVRNCNLLFELYLFYFFFLDEKRIKKIKTERSFPCSGHCSGPPFCQPLLFV